MWSCSGTFTQEADTYSEAFGCEITSTFVPEPKEDGTMDEMTASDANAFEGLFDAVKFPASAANDDSDSEDESNISVV